MSVEHALPLACAASGAGWAITAALRSGHATAHFAARALLGGVASWLIAGAAYDLAIGAGLAVSWERLASGGRTAVLLGGFVGLAEEGAKLVGLLLVVQRGWRQRAVAAAAMGVAAGFAALEAAVTLDGAPWSAAIGARLLLAPVAHALLFAPVAAAVAHALRRGGVQWAWLAPALAAAAALHGVGNASLALPQLGRAGYAAALLAPALALFLAARRAGVRQ
jgi:RsiW-degrading membrane proteinase PrsW (M82 family)